MNIGVYCSIIDVINGSSAHTNWHGYCSVRCSVTLKCEECHTFVVSTTSIHSDSITKPCSSDSICMSPLTSISSGFISTTISKLGKMTYSKFNFRQYTVLIKMPICYRIKNRRRHTKYSIIRIIKITYVNVARRC